MLTIFRLKTCVARSFLWKILSIFDVFDILLIASFSGNSSELINILKFAKRFKIKTIGISSNGKSKLISSSDIKLITPKIKELGEESSEEMYQTP